MALAMAAAMVLTGLTACGGGGKEASPATQAAAAGGNTEAAAAQPEGGSGEQKRIDVIAKGFQHQFWKAVEQGTQQAAAEFNVEVNFQGPDNESAIAQQVEYLNAAIANQPDAICLAALDTSASLDSIKSAMEAGIPIIGFDSGVPDAPKGAIKANASTDNTAAGAMAAEKLYEIVKDQVTDPAAPVRIGVIAQESNSQSIVSRTRGFVDKMTELVGADKVSVEGHDSLKNEKAGALVILDVGIPAEVKDVDAAAVASAILENPISLQSTAPTSLPPTLSLQPTRAWISWARAKWLPSGLMQAQNFWMRFLPSCSQAPSPRILCRLAIRRSSLQWRRQRARQFPT